MIWTQKPTPKELNERCQNTLISHLNILFTAVEEDSLTATMPVTPHTHQPMGILHGGASAALAETVGSAGANFCTSPDHFAVGLDLNINHLRPVQSGTLTATAAPFHLGKTTQVWEIKIYQEKGKLVAIARLTMAVLPKKA